MLTYIQKQKPEPAKTRTQRLAEVKTLYLCLVLLDRSLWQR
jgi:hypothetical protein